MFWSYRTRVLYNESYEKAFSKFFRLNIEIVWSLRTTDGKEVVAEKIFRLLNTVKCSVAIEYYSTLVITLRRSAEIKI